MQRFNNFLLSCSILIVNCNIVSPTLNDNPTYLSVLENILKLLFEDYSCNVRQDWCLFLLLEAADEQRD